MSYDVYLNDPVTGETIEFAFVHEISGGTMEMGGTRRAWLNVTYNYAGILGQVLDGGIRSLYGKTAAETIPAIRTAIEKLRDDVDGDYWKPTEGNVKQALCGLLAFAQLRPDGIWDGD